MNIDPRLDLFSDPTLPDPFQDSVSPASFWLPDPCDIPTLHQEAQETFEYLIAKIASRTQSSGRLWLLMGDAGTGKTHLLRRFRHHLHSQRSGYFSYIPLITMPDDYAKHLLHRFLDALDKPYNSYNNTSTITGLQTIADTIASLLPEEALQFLREEDRFRHSPNLLYELVHNLADQLVRQKFPTINADLIYALLYLQRRDPQTKQSVLHYLRCQSPSDEDVYFLLNDLIPSRDPEAPLQILSDLSNLMYRSHGQLCVMALDLLTDNPEQFTPTHFRHLLRITITLADKAPSLLVIISCRPQFYQAIRYFLTQSALDRLEYDPSETRLTPLGSLAELEQLLVCRLNQFYRNHHLPLLPQHNPIYPFSQEMMTHITPQSPQHFLTWCQQQRQLTIKNRQPHHLPDLPAEDPSININRIDQLWHYHLLQEKSAPTKDHEKECMKLLIWAAPFYFSQSDHHLRIEAPENLDPVKIKITDLQGNRLGAFCLGWGNGSTRGHGLSHQIERLLEQSPSHIPVCLRDIPFPQSNSSKIGRQLAQMVSQGGRLVVVEASDWRMLIQLKTFLEIFPYSLDLFQQWSQQQAIFTQGIPSLQKIFSLSKNPA